MRRLLSILLAIILFAFAAAWPAGAWALPSLPPIKFEPEYVPIDPELLDALNALMEVNIPDPKLRNALCVLLGKAPGDTINRGDMADLSGDISLADKGIKNLEGMQFAVNIQELNLSGNPIENMPEAMEDLSNLQYLALTSCSLSQVPPVVWEMVNLKGLYLSDNQLASLSEDIGNLSHLTSLSLDLNALESLPANMGALTNLKELSARINQLKTLPQSMQNCTKLEFLFLRGNQLTEFPAWTGNLINIKRLSLDINQIKSLPESLKNLDKLTDLSVSFNRLSDFPECVLGMGSLEVLNMAVNDIDSLPFGLSSLPLEHLYIEWNDLALDDPGTKGILDTMKANGVWVEDIPQKPVPTLSAETGETGVNLSWPFLADESSDILNYKLDGFKLQRKSGEGDYETIAEPPPGTVSHVDEDVEPGTAYTYKIRSRYQTETTYGTYTTYRVSTCKVDVPVAVTPTPEPTPEPTPVSTPEPTPALTTVPSPETDTEQSASPATVAGDSQTGGEAGATASEAGLQIGGVRSPSNGLLIGIGILGVLLLGVLTVLIILLVKRGKTVPAQEKPGQEQDDSQSEEQIEPGETSPDDKNEDTGPKEQDLPGEEKE